MFYRRCRRHGILAWLLILLGLKTFTSARERMTAEEREQFRSKARAFRGKVREAVAVWDGTCTKADEEPNV